MMKFGFEVNFDIFNGQNNWGRKKNEIFMRKLACD